MRAYVSFRLSRLVRVGVPVNIGRGGAWHFPPWLGWVIVALIILGVARGYC